MRVHQLYNPGEVVQKQENCICYVEVLRTQMGWAQEIRLCLGAALVQLCLLALSLLGLELAGSKCGRACWHFSVDLALLLLQSCISSSLEGIYRICC